MKKVVAFVRAAMVFLLMLVAATSSHQPASAEEIDQVSLVQLIGAPERFDGKRVIVKGLATMEFEGNALFLSEADAEHLITKNAVWLELSSEQVDQQQWSNLDRKFVLVQGEFRAAARGHLGGYCGSLMGIERIERLPRRDELRGE